MRPRLKAQFHNFWNEYLFKTFIDVNKNIPIIDISKFYKYWYKVWWTQPRLNLSFRSNTLSQQKYIIYIYKRVSQLTQQSPIRIVLSREEHEKFLPSFNVKLSHCIQCQQYTALSYLMRSTQVSLYLCMYVYVYIYINIVVLVNIQGWFVNW